MYFSLRIQGPTNLSWRLLPVLERKSFEFQKIPWVILVKNAFDAPMGKEFPFVMNSC